MKSKTIAEELICQDEEVVEKLTELQDWLKSKGIPYVHHFVFLNKLGSPVDKSHKDTPTKEDSEIAARHLVQMIGHLYGVEINYHGKLNLPDKEDEVDDNK